MGFTETPQSVPDVSLLEGPRFGDSRGFFGEVFRASDFDELGIPPLVQHNHSRSTKGVLRGLHYQLPPAALGKLVRCARGAILDVAVDLRRGSATFGQHVAVELNDEANTMLWIPEGFAHGFLTLSDVADVIYMQSGYWSPDHERAIRWDDPTLAIPWPETNPALSAKDVAAPRLEAAELFW